MSHPKPSPGRKLFCFGFGYTCEFFANALKAQGDDWSIAGTTRDLAKKNQMRKHGIGSYLFDYEKPLGDPRHFFKGTTHLLLSAPPGDGGDPAFLAHAEDLLRVPTLEWVGYLSSTAVYGNRDGGWVDEETEAQPGNKRGSRRLTAENQWLELHRKHGMPAHVFRIAGIYGPHRSALDSVRTGSASRIDKPGHAFSRIHIDDIVQVLLASIANPNPGRIYNLCDDMPTASEEVIAYACELLGLKPPPLVPYDEIRMPPIARSFFSDNKRVRNSRIKEELEIKLKYPDYKAGLRGCLAAEKETQPIFTSSSSGEAAPG
jgi:hypothetical protein